MKNVIYKLRMEKGLTQQQVAKKLNISQQAYQRYENTDIKSISLETLLKLTDVFQTTLSYLLGLNKEEDQHNNKLISNRFNQMTIEEGLVINERKKINELVNKLSYYSCLEANAFITRLIAKDEQEYRYWNDKERIKEEEQMYRQFKKFLNNCENKEDKP